MDKRMEKKRKKTVGGVSKTTTPIYARVLFTTNFSLPLGSRNTNVP